MNASIGHVRTGMGAHVTTAGGKTELLSVGMDTCNAERGVTQGEFAKGVLTPWQGDDQAWQASRPRRPDSNPAAIGYNGTGPSPAM